MPTTLLDTRSVWQRGYDWIDACYAAADPGELNEPYVAGLLQRYRAALTDAATADVPGTDALERVGREAAGFIADELARRRAEGRDPDPDDVAIAEALRRAVTGG